MNTKERNQKRGVEGKCRCAQCGYLLGIVFSDRLFIKHKKYALSISGDVLARCPRCEFQNEVETGSQAVQGLGR